MRHNGDLKIDVRFIELAIYLVALESSKRYVTIHSFRLDAVMSGYTQALKYKSELRVQQKFSVTPQSHRLQMLGEADSLSKCVSRGKNTEAKPKDDVREIDQPFMSHEDTSNTGRARNTRKLPQWAEKPEFTQCNAGPIDSSIATSAHEAKMARLESLRRHNALRKSNSASKINRMIPTNLQNTSLHLVGEAQKTGRILPPDADQVKREDKPIESDLLIDHKNENSEERVLVCGNCTIIEAELWCAICFQVYCRSCWTEIHRNSVDFSSFSFPHFNKTDLEHPLAPEIYPLRPNQKCLPFGFMHLRVEPLNKTRSSTNRRENVYCTAKSRNRPSTRFAASKSLPSLDGIGIALSNSLTL
uniref:AlNc14C60G4433 protein n=1 Tax=Albugo laibachii Nc14 TaxID=890382 RepID=F0WCQ2_9STRA|nr:AlNc14C60G4433 [Albugo laibachii Nc14]|eukprot:CCA18973.1 AlNc14C60G4433 [Albugo laibachii Nc14]